MPETEIKRQISGGGGRESEELRESCRWKWNCMERAVGCGQSSKREAIKASDRTSPFHNAPDSFLFKTLQFCITRWSHRNIQKFRIRTKCQIWMSPWRHGTAETVKYITKQSAKHANKLKKNYMGVMSMAGIDADLKAFGESLTWVKDNKDIYTSWTTCCSWWFSYIIVSFIQTRTHLCQYLHKCSYNP